MRPLFVGEAQSSHGGGPFSGLGSDGRKRPGGSGARLAGILGLTVDEMHDRFEFTNLLDEVGAEWDRHRAATKASVIRSQLRVGGGTVVLLGRRVHDAFYEGFEPFTWWSPKFGAAPVIMVSLPHPSGRSRIWNDPESKIKTRRILAEAGVL